MRATRTELRAPGEAQNAQRAWAERVVLRVRLEHEGALGWGEAAPLPGYSEESLEEARRALDAVAWPDAPPTSLAEVAQLTDAIGPPSARFAAQSALLSLAAAEAGEPLWRWLGEARAKLPIAQALWETDVAARVEAAARSSAEVFKVKVGGATLAEERSDLARLRAAIGDAELRLDANRSVPAGELDARLAAWAEVSPAFVEEPAPLDAIAKLARCPVPLALDESLVESPARALAAPHVTTFVLKPARLGLLESLRLAQRSDRAIVISHLLDGPVARAACAHLALVVSDRAAGLGAHPYLEGLAGGWAVPWIGEARIVRPDAPGLGLEAA